MANVQVRITDELRDKAQAVAADMGLDLASVVRVFLSQMVRENGLPFKPYADPFYSRENQTALKHSLTQLKSGKTITKTLDALEAMEE